MIRYRPKEILTTDLSGYKPKKKREVIIIKYDTNNEDVWIPSQLSDYLHVYKSEKSNNTKFSMGYAICEFINYTLEQVEKGENKDFEILKEKGFYGLNFKHVAEYITYISKYNNLSYTTVRRKENVIIDFFKFLNQKNILTDKDATVERKLIQIKRNGHSTRKGMYVSIHPFDNNPKYKVYRPAKNPSSQDGEKKKAPLKDMNEEVWMLMLEFAEERYPDIAFGVALQCMGGLRLGDVVNLTIDDVKAVKEQHVIYLNIEDRQIELFGKKSCKKSEVKTVRENQPVFNFNGELFKSMDKYMNYLNRQKRNNKNALFINSHGNPMTGNTYEQRFQKLKADFIDFLEYSKPTEAYVLKEHTWATHIGRHIFTNFIIRKGLTQNSMGEHDPKILSALRGDKSIASALTYINPVALVESVTEIISQISKASKERG
ncbi:tyrosine-type recombinase/integrase [Romboutsia sp. 1001713B170207_170306_H8]|uniref:tyrosine-type recombinase/integrase n=1 Tax=Romboutsia sp. 1001713B170207_170306_H8 TaxID=2787112 RepID=UPI001898325B|nr:tyrosine-type recombinase/integrase [Romboutsia sp. 1001713B170207_170306_H8]